MFVFTDPSAQLAASRPPSKRLVQSRNFNGISQLGAGPMCFHIGYLFRINPGNRQCLGHHRRLALHTRGREAHLAGAIVVHGGATNDSVDSVSIGESVGETFEYHQTRAIAANCALCQGVKRPAVAVGRANAARMI